MIDDGPRQNGRTLDAEQILVAMFKSSPAGRAEMAPQIVCKWLLNASGWLHRLPVLPYDVQVLRKLTGDPLFAGGRSGGFSGSEFADPVVDRTVYLGRVFQLSARRYLSSQS